MKGTLREGSFTGDLERYVNKDREWASASIGGPLLGNMEGRFFLRAFLCREIFKRFSRDMQNAS
jgi:hypothetical protein